MHEILKPGITLFIVTVIAAISLGFAHSITEEPIAQQKIITRDNAMNQLLPSDYFEEAEQPPNNASVNNYFTGFDNGGTILGHVVSVVSSGYGGDMEMLVAILPDGTIQGVNIVSHSETPGLGAIAQTPGFTDQYKGKSGVLSVTKSEDAKDNEIVAITSATITTVSVTTGVNNALGFWNSNLKGGN